MKMNVELESLQQKELLKLARACAKAYNNNANMIDGKLKVKLDR